MIPVSLSSSLSAFPSATEAEVGWGSDKVQPGSRLSAPRQLPAPSTSRIQCVSSALTVHCPALPTGQWLEKTQQAQVCDAGRGAGEGPGLDTRGEDQERREKLGRSTQLQNRTSASGVLSEEDTALTIAQGTRRRFPGGPMDRTLRFHCQELVGFSPWSEG